jgi:hypothetical protein
LNCLRRDQRIWDIGFGGPYLEDQFESKSPASFLVGAGLGAGLRLENGHRFDAMLGQQQFGPLDAGE